MAHLAKACPILAAPEVRASAEWYRDRLGFAIRRVHEDYAIVERDGIELHFWQCRDRSIAEATSAYIRVDDIEAVHASCGAAADGGRISAVEDRDWGMREFYVWDPAGNLLRFGQYDTLAKPEDKTGHTSADALLEAVERLSPDEFKRQIAETDVAIREGRL